MGNTDDICTLSFTYDRTLVFDGASVPIINNTNNTIVWQDTLAAGCYGNNYINNGYNNPCFYFTVSQNAALGDVTLATATIASTNAYADFTAVDTIQSSFDPNDKQATPSLTSAEVAKGAMIDYIIRFQNTGNAPEI